MKSTELKTTPSTRKRRRPSLVIDLTKAKDGSPILGISSRSRKLGKHQRNVFIYLIAAQLEEHADRLDALEFDRWAISVQPQRSRIVVKLANSLAERAAWTFVESTLECLTDDRGFL